MPTAIIIAGPNGAGKTTFASEYFAADDRDFDFVNADEIARVLGQGSSGQVSSNMLAARAMLSRIDQLVDVGADFAVETTLATLTYARKIPAWQRRGYIVSLIYLRLRSVSDSLARVRRRVEAGGHGIAERVIRRRFDKSWRYFENVYRPMVDEWYVWDSREGHFALIDAWNRDRQ